VKFPWQISAGQFFELLRPAALVLSALLSVWVLTSSRRRGYRLPASLSWTLGTFFFPVIILPIYLVTILIKRRSDKNADEGETKASRLRFRYLLPCAYAVVLLSAISLYVYADYRSVDAHLARAAQAKVMNQRARTIREYEAALRLEDNPHTHKLLGMELVDDGQWTAALRELRAAESGGEQDDVLTFLIGRALDATGHVDEARLEFQKFLASQACVGPIPDNRCDNAREKIGEARKME